MYENVHFSKYRPHFTGPPGNIMHTKISACCEKTSEHFQKFSEMRKGKSCAFDSVTL